MIHHTCDRCKRLIDENEIRYVVNVEVVASVSSEQESEVAHEQLEELEELLEQLDQTQHAELRSDIYQTGRFDLCQQCRTEYLENPLAVDRQLEFEFSRN